MEKKSIIEQLLKQGSKMVKNVIIKNVTITPMENYVRVGLTLDRPISGYTADADGNYTLGETKVIFVSLFSIAANLRDNEEASFAVNHMIKKPTASEVLLNGATIDIIQESVKAGSEYHNPWSEGDTIVTFDHDTLINHVVNLRLTKRSVTLLDNLAASMLGI